MCVLLSVGLNIKTLPLCAVGQAGMFPVLAVSKQVILGIYWGYVRVILGLF